MKAKNFKIGDRVKIIIPESEYKTGVIVIGSSFPFTTGKLEPVITWWRILLDGTDEYTDWPDDKLEKIE